MVRVVKCWNKLPASVVTAPLVDIFKKSLDKGWIKYFLISLLEWILIFPMDPKPAAHAYGLTCIFDINLLVTRHQDGYLQMTVHGKMTRTDRKLQLNNKNPNVHKLTMHVMSLRTVCQQHRRITHSQGPQCTNRWRLSYTPIYWTGCIRVGQSAPRRLLKYKF